MSKPNGRDLFNIKIMKWDKHNPKRKKHYKYILVANNLYLHPKINAASTSSRWAYMVLLMMCGDANDEQVSITRRALNDAVTSRRDAAKVLDELQSLQLLTYEKIPFLRIEENKKKNRKEENRIEHTSEVKKPALAQVEFIDDDVSHKPKNDPVANKKVKDAFCDAYVKRYKVEPKTNQKFNIAVSDIVKRLGAEDAVKVVNFYLNHNDGFYVKTMHSIGICLRDCEALRIQMLRGKTVTSNDIRNFEKTDHYKSQLERIAKGEA